MEDGGGDHSWCLSQWKQYVGEDTGMAKTVKRFFLQRREIPRIEGR